MLASKQSANKQDTKRKELMLETHGGEKRSCMIQDDERSMIVMAIEYDPTR